MMNEWLIMDSESFIEDGTNLEFTQNILYSHQGLKKIEPKSMDLFSTHGPFKIKIAN